MKRFVIERDVPGVGGLASGELAATVAKSNEALRALKGRAQWLHSYVTDDKTFCVYLAEDERAVAEHARLSGLPANRITAVRGVVDALTGQV